MCRVRRPARRRPVPGAISSPLALVVRDGRLRRRRALTADDFGAAALGIVHDDRNVAAGTVEMRLDHLQRKGGVATTGVRTRLAALFQNTHADGGWSAIQWVEVTTPKVPSISGRGGEWIGIDVAHGNPMLRW